jgi:hypothetical protein
MNIKKEITNIENNLDKIFKEKKKINKKVYIIKENN